VKLHVFPGFLLLAGCSDNFCIDGGETCWASRDQIIEAAARCGVPDFEPTKAGAVWAAYVPSTVSNHAAKEDCIYEHFRRENLLVTR